MYRDVPARELTAALGGRWLGTYGLARCPAHDDRSPSLSIAEGHDGRLLLYCFAGCDFEAIRAALVAARLMAGKPDWAALDHTAMARREVEARRERARREARARRIWEGSRAAKGTPAELYLRSRFLELPEGPPLRFHPVAPHPSGAGVAAMVARIKGGEGFAVHCTYLDPSGGKADIEPRKAIFGLPRGAARPG